MRGGRGGSGNGGGRRTHSAFESMRRDAGSMFTRQASDEEKEEEGEDTT